MVEGSGDQYVQGSRLRLWSLGLSGVSHLGLKAYASRWKLFRTSTLGVQLVVVGMLGFGTSTGGTCKKCISALLRWACVLGVWVLRRVRLEGFWGDKTAVAQV